MVRLLIVETIGTWATPDRRRIAAIIESTVGMDNILVSALKQYIEHRLFAPEHLICNIRPEQSSITQEEPGYNPGNFRSPIVTL